VPGAPVVRSRPEHRNPALQVPEVPVPQHDCPDPPQVPQTLPDAEVRHEPVVHGVAPVQQGWPSPPQAPQVPVIPCATFRPAQTNPVLQVPVFPEPQHDFPDAPQSELAAQTLPSLESMHESSVSQVADPPRVLGQQGLPAPPQALQVPPPRTPPSTLVVKQPSPLWQLLPEQQAAPSAPQLSQVPALAPVTLQPRPVLQVLPEQHGWPEPPQAVQVCAPPEVAQTREARHCCPEQHGAPSAPQATQFPFVQRAPEAVQVPAPPPPKPASAPAPQQGWPMPPQASPPVLVHELVAAEQVPLMPLPVHACPAATHTRVVPVPPLVVETQQPLALQALAVQQGCPGSPQAVPELPPGRLELPTMLELPPFPPLPVLAVVPPPLPPTALVLLL
jgi:hypothetical protein